MSFSMSAAETLGRPRRGLPAAGRCVFQAPAHFGAGQPSLLGVARTRAPDELQEVGIGAERDGLEICLLERDKGGERLPIVGDDDRSAPACPPNVGCQGLGRVGDVYFLDRHGSNSFLPIRSRCPCLMPMARMSSLRSGSSSTS